MEKNLRKGEEMNTHIVGAINMALKQEMQRDKNVVVLGEDVGVDGGVFRCTEGLIEKYGKERVIDTPLAESGIIGTSLGMALNGLKPVPEIQFSGFLMPAFDQIYNHVSRYRNRSRGKFTASMVIRCPYSGGFKGLEHHIESPEALFAHTPGIKVVIPSRPYDAKGLLAAAIEDRDPVIFFEPIRIYRAIKEEVPEKRYTIELEKANIVQEGEDCTIVSYGAMMRDVLQAVEEVGKSIEVIDLMTISPMDFETIQESVEKTGRLVIVHEAPKTCGVGAEIAARIAEEDILSLKAPIERITGWDTIFPDARLEKAYLPDKERIKKAVEKVLNF